MLKNCRKITLDSKNNAESTKISKWQNSLQIIIEKAETESKDQKNLHSIYPDFASVLACTETIKLIRFFFY